MSKRIALLSVVTALTFAACEKGSATPDEASPWVELACVVEAKLSHGKLSTTLPSGESFSGTYLNVTRDTPAANVDPYHQRWGEGFGSAANGDAAAWRADQEGHVVGLLSGDKSTKMRCVLTLDMPDVGMEGGGEGTCELSSGDVLRARFTMK